MYCYFLPAHDVLRGPVPKTYDAAEAVIVAMDTVLNEADSLLASLSALRAGEAVTTSLQDDERSLPPTTPSLTASSEWLLRMLAYL